MADDWAREREREKKKHRRDAMIIVAGSSKHLAAWHGAGEKNKLALQEQPNKQTNKEEPTKQCGTK